ncbi:QWRF motif-containing protein 7-like [Neltuma alba]|uniref:QWRF motif-containing protein 7-like n=1 Tax=Neltuma alba TaxID=207710 RepID=UPI0010A46608|nr:QWRF motif-containing protein 7-like [Prosopis alba]
MDKENNSGRRNPRTVLRSPSPSPRLCRSKSGSNLSSLTTTPENSSRRFGSSQRFVSNTNRSKSTSKTRRTCNNEDSTTNPSSSSASARKSQEIISNRNNRSDGVGSSKRMTAKSPSAWALSPGRFLGLPAASSSSETPGKVKSNSNGVSKVLRYFRQKKVSSVQEDEHHRFRILHNRLLQWRFVNARAESAMVNVKKASEADVASLHEAMKTALEIMESIDPLIRKYQSQVFPL